MSRRAFRGLVITAALLLGIAAFAVACGGSVQTATTSAASATTADSNGTGASGSDSSGSIVFSGLVDYPMTFNALDMDYMDWVSVTADNPDTGSTAYDGVHLSEIFTYVGAQPAAKTVAVTGSSGSTVELTLADISSDALLAAADDGSLNLVMPGMGSDAWVKDVVKMEFK